MARLGGPHKPVRLLWPYWGLLGLVLIGGFLGIASIVSFYLQKWEREQDQALLASQRMDANRDRLGIERTLTVQAEAWNQSNLEGFMAGYWDSPELEFVSGTTTTKGFQPTKERYFKRYKADGREMGTLAFRDLRITLTAATEATVTGRWKLTMSKESPAGGFTLTFRKFDDGWKIVKDVTTSDDPPKKD